MFELDLKGRKSIYEQVMDNFKEQILLGLISANEKLPSVRELSKNLTVNPNTIQKAYRELERQGYIYSIAGKGTFASAKEDIGPDERIIADVKARLFDDVKELFYLFPEEKAVRKILDDVAEEVRAQLSSSATAGTQTAGRDIKNTQAADRDRSNQKSEVTQDDSY